MKKESAITIRVSEQELEKINQKAKLFDMSTSEFIRFVCLNSKIVVETSKKEE